AIAPAMFDRVQRDVELGYTAETVAAGRALRAKIGYDDAMRDVAAAVTAGTGKIGVVGYCWGGSLAWLAAARVPGLACAVSYYGGNVLEHADAAPRCPMLAHFGERDTMIPVAGVRELAARYPAAEIHV